MGMFNNLELILTNVQRPVGTSWHPSLVTEHNKHNYGNRNSHWLTSSITTISFNVKLQKEEYFAAIFVLHK